MTDLEVLAKLAQEATPPEDCYVCGHSEHDHHHSAVPRWCGLCDGCTGYHGVALTALHVAASPDVVLALVRVALAARPMLDHHDDLVSVPSGEPLHCREADSLRAAFADLDRAGYQWNTDKRNRAKVRRYLEEVPV